MGCRLYAPTQSESRQQSCRGVGRARSVRQLRDEGSRHPLARLRQRDLHRCRQCRLTPLDPQHRNLAPDPAALRLLRFDVCGGTQNTAVGTTTPDGFVPHARGWGMQRGRGLRVGSRRGSGGTLREHPRADPGWLPGLHLGTLLSGWHVRSRGLHLGVPVEGSHDHAPADARVLHGEHRRRHARSVHRTGARATPTELPPVARHSSSASRRRSGGSVAEAVSAEGSRWRPGVLFLDFQMQNVPSRV